MRWPCTLVVCIHGSSVGDGSGGCPSRQRPCMTSVDTTICCALPIRMLPCSTSLSWPVISAPRLFRPSPAAKPVRRRRGSDREAVCPRNVFAVAFSWMFPVRRRTATGISTTASARSAATVRPTRDATRSLLVRLRPSFFQAWEISGMGKTKGWTA